jgi:RNase P protein component
VRNRLRRQLRAVFSSVVAEVTPGTYLLGAGPSAVGLPPGSLRTHVDAALHRAGAR